MHGTPLLFGASQLHVHASAILADPRRFFRLIDEKAWHNPAILFHIILFLVHRIGIRSELPALQANS
jgi:hypothetical protein